MKYSIVFLSLALGFRLACGPGLAANFGKSEEEDILEAVLRHELRLQATQGRKVFYLAVGLENPTSPPAKFMDRFKDLPLVKKFIAREYNATQIRQEKGIVIGTYKVKRKTESEAEVEMYHFVVPGEAQGFRFRVLRENGKWFVKQVEATWIASFRVRSSHTDDLDHEPRSVDVGVNQQNSEPALIRIHY